MKTTSHAVGAPSLKDGLAASRAGDRHAVLRIASQQMLLGLLPVFVLVWLLHLVFWHRHNVVALDFHDAYWVAAHRLLHGGDPYAWTRYQLHAGVAFVYPALSALVFVPFALIPQAAASVVFTLVCVACVPLTLWVLGVRDWRVYGITLLWEPVFDSWQTGNETIALVLMVALVWRHRDKPVAAGLITAVAISLKPVIWPLALWLVVTRRWRASAYTLVSGVLINLIAWSVVGFNKISVYLRDSGIDTHHAWRAGYSIAAALSHLGAGHHVGDVAIVIASLALAGAVVYVGFVRGAELQALTLTIILMLAASPLVWGHYFTLLLIPMALTQARMSWLWILPVLMWVCPPSWHVYGWEEALAWLLAGMMFAATLRTRQDERAVT